MPDTTPPAHEQPISNVVVPSLDELADLRAPEQHYPLARQMRRRIIYHSGPTNSGKTYHSIERLKEAAGEGHACLFAGPLRLLALEVYQRLNREGTACALIETIEHLDAAALEAVREQRRQRSRTTHDALGVN